MGIQKLIDNMQGEKQEMQSMIDELLDKDICSNMRAEEKHKRIDELEEKLRRALAEIDSLSQRNQELMGRNVTEITTIMSNSYVGVDVGELRREIERLKQEKQTCLDTIKKLTNSNNSSEEIQNFLEKELLLTKQRLQKQEDLALRLNERITQLMRQLETSEEKFKKL